MKNDKVIDAARDELTVFLLAGKYDHDRLKELWHAYFSACLSDMCWNESAIEDMFDWGKNGHNWSELHWNHCPSLEHEYEGDMRSLQGDVFYTSDCMSLDRLFRMHHAYNRIQCE